MYEIMQYIEKENMYDNFKENNPQITEINPNTIRSPKIGIISKLLIIERKDILL